jgi:hypothetical protein
MPNAPMFDFHAQSQYGVGWLTLSLINAGLAQAKGRTGFNWWLLSLSGLAGRICYAKVAASSWPVMPDSFCSVPSPLRPAKSLRRS